jgi:TusE/DsrC/DsvC family sulfur relay protein
MAFFNVGDKELEIDDDGFIQEPEQWDDEVAAALASAEGVDRMSEDHWKLVRYVRDHFIEFGVAPMIRDLCKATGFKLARVYELFPSGPAKGACRVAGLPKPTGCV